MIEFKAECGHTIRVKDEDAGKVVRCSYCGRETQAPDKDAGGSNDLEYLFSEVEKTGVYETESDRTRVKRMRGAKRGAKPQVQRRREPGVNPFGVVLKLCYVCVIVAVLIFVGKKVYNRVTEPETRRRTPVVAQPSEGPEGPGSVAAGGGRMGLLRPKLSREGNGIYVNSVPPGADVLITDRGRISRSESIFRLPSNQLEATLKSGEVADRLKPGRDYDVYVALRINHPELMRLPGYPDLRRRYEETGDERLFEDYFLPDGATDVRTDRRPNRPTMIVRKYECHVSERTWNPVVALFLPELPLADLLRYLPRQSSFGFREADVEAELEYYGISTGDRKHMVNILSRIGMVPYRDADDGYYRIFAINLMDGSIYRRQGRFGDPDGGASIDRSREPAGRDGPTALAGAWDRP
jgi:hypothetical protein